MDCTNCLKWTGTVSSLPVLKKDLDLNKAVKHQPPCRDYHPEVAADEAELKRVVAIESRNTYIDIQGNWQSIRDQYARTSLSSRSHVNISPDKKIPTTI